MFTESSDARSGCRQNCLSGDQVFVAGAAGFEGIPSLRPEQLEGFNRYKAILDRRTPDFQTRQGYPVARPGKGNLTMATSQIAERFGAVSMTLEMPFKDHDDLPCAAQGWSPERSRILGRDCLAALLEWLE